MCSQLKAVCFFYYHIPSGFKKKGGVCVGVCGCVWVCVSFNYPQLLFCKYNISGSRHYLLIKKPLI
jgi:hypothetical protein